MNELVSVIVPVYNRAHLVTETIQSILSQTYEFVEIILINDGSTDGSLPILREYEGRFPEKIRVIDQPNQGQIIARNNGIKMAKGNYIAFLDSDDVWMENKLERQLPLFEPGVGLVFSGTEIIDEAGNTLRVENADSSLSGNIFPQLLVRNRMTGGTVVVTAEALRRVGIFCTDFKAAENWDLWLRVCKLYKARVVPDPLIKYRIHSSNMSGDSQLMLDAKRQIMEKYCDLGSSDAIVVRYSRQAYADYYYREGLNYFAAERYQQARKAFFSVFGFSPLYKDTWVRFLRSFLGVRGNRLLRTFK
jgi:glycosyltransferase involved in cell wall biosynthesis